MSVIAVLCSFCDKVVKAQDSLILGTSPCCQDCFIKNLNTHTQQDEQARSSSNGTEGSEIKNSDLLGALKSKSNKRDGSPADYSKIEVGE